MQGNEIMDWIVGFKKNLRYHYSSTPDGIAPDICNAEVLDLNFGILDSNIN